MSGYPIDRSKVKDLIGGVATIAVGLGIAAATMHLPAYAGRAPGAGFFPHGLAATLTGLGMLLVVLTLVRRTQPETEEAERPTVSLGRVAGVAVGFVGAVALIPVAGFLLAMAALTVFFMVIIEGVRPPRAVVFSSVLVLAVYLVFALGLGVPFPRGPLGF